MSEAPRALIIGLGLIGGSIGIALRRAGWRVAFADPHVSLDDAKRAGAADEAGGSGEITILATPVDVALRLLPEARGLVTTVCSVMTPLREARYDKLIAGHPLAGSARRGLGAADGDLFRGRKWFVDADDPTVDRIINDCGATKIRVDAREHDAAVALTSHLPQLLSTALAAHLEGKGVDAFAGSGLATFLRLAESDASVWRPILEANRAEIETHIEPLFALVRGMLAGEDRAFESARDFVRRLRGGDNA